MRRASKFWLSFSVILNIAGFIEPALAAKPGEESKKITFCVYDHLRVKAGTLVQKAKKEAERIFRQAGVETEWRDLPTSQAEASGKATNVLEQLGPADLY